MNRVYQKLSDALKSEFYKAFGLQDNDEIFMFFRRLLRYIEHYDSQYKYSTML